MAVLRLKSAEMETFPIFVREFAAYKSVIENCSEKTVCEYLYDIRTFFRFLVAQRQGIDKESEEFLSIDLLSVDIPFLESVTETDIYTFLNYTAADRNNGWSARARKITALKSFFRYLVKNKRYLEKDPMQNIESPKRHSSLPKVLTLEEAQILLDTIRRDESSKTVVRDFCIVTLFLNCGMRVSELVSIDLTDLRPHLESLTVIGKGRKERLVYLNDACKKALMSYIALRQQQNKKGVGTAALFISERGDRISVKTIQYIVYKYLDRAGLGGRGLSVHKLRHTAATLMYQYGKVDVRVLKDILGHEQLNTTQIYTHVSDEGMQAAMEKNPLSNITIEDDHENEPTVLR